MKTSLKTLPLASLTLLSLSACSVLPLIKDGQEAKLSSSSSAVAQVASNQVQPVAIISQEEAIKAALAQLGISQDQVTNLVVEAGTEGNKAVYDVSFTYEGAEYNYTIDGQTGQLVEQEAERAEASVASTLLSDEAKALAIQDFSSAYGVGEESLSNLVVEQSIDDGRTVYEVSFVYNNMSFDYELDANTGDIVAFDQGDLD